MLLWGPLIVGEMSGQIRQGVEHEILHSTATLESLKVFVIAVVRIFQTLLMT